jgi:CheY-like chemotaxis protein
LPDKKQVLIVDDDKSIIRTFSRILQKGGYEVEVAETGKDAIGKANQKHFDVALIDYRLPDMEGTKLLLNAKGNFQNTIKIMITGLPSMEVGTMALDEGADAYLIKPVKPEELLSLIAEKLKPKAS